MLRALLPSGLAVDTYGDYGFIAIAMVRTKPLHPAFLPSALGVDFFLTGYRLFTRFARKPSLRGLRILRSDTDRLLMTVGGNLLAGPYRWVRHPSYTGSLLTIAGVLLCLVNVASLFALIIPLAGYAYRIRVEEDALVRSLGEPYRAYMRRTRRLIPFVV